MFFDPRGQLGRMSHTIVGVFGSSVEPVFELLLLLCVQILVVTTASVCQPFEPLGVIVTDLTCPLKTSP